MNAFAVLHFHFAQIMQMRSPSSVLLQIFGHSLGQQDVTGVPAIHQTLGDIDTDSGGVDATVNISDRANWAAVHAHAHRQIGIMFQNAADLYRALDRLLGTILKNERYAVPGRNLLESLRGGRSTELVRAANPLVA